MVVDLGVLAKADAFVGSLWSNVGRLAYELSAADKGCLPPLISRDVGWCSVDGQLQDGTVYGHLNCRSPRQCRVDGVGRARRTRARTARRAKRRHVSDTNKPWSQIRSTSCGSSRRLT